ncbi:MAG: lycopene cyclase domain-containing protein [Flavobacteriaceae bacterium]|nr:lycopene cyclase domain-containing protein [Flavobacteriaceae bacterium]
MTGLYLYLLLGSVLVPLLYSIFVLDIIKYWKQFSFSTIIIAIVFLIWDYFFTKAGIWGFNDNYCLGLKIFKMPIEEWLFFLIIPFCSLFIHYAFLYLFPSLKLKTTTTFYITIALIIISIALVLMNFSKSYTVVNFTVLTFFLLLGLIYYKILLQKFYITFLIILIPFLIINGILTGSLIVSPVVWYNDLENLGFRIHTIPIEDVGYCFSLLFGNLVIFENLKKKVNKK